MSGDYIKNEHGLDRAQFLARMADTRARLRGHQLGMWAWDIGTARSLGSAFCRDCGAVADIDTRPDRPGRDILGRAVAESCSHAWGAS